MTGVVSSVKPYGAFVDLGGVTGLLHVSQISHERITNVDKVLQEKDKIKVGVGSVFLFLCLCFRTHTQDTPFRVSLLAACIELLVQNSFS